MTEKKKRARKPRAKKAPVETVQDSPTLDVEKMEEEGFEKSRARDDKGHFVKDDPSTPGNEAFEWVKEVDQEEVVVIPTPEPEFEIVFTPDPELDIVFTPDINSQEEVAKRVANAKKIMAEKRKDLLAGLDQTQFGRGRTQMRRRTRREEQ